MTLKEYQKNKKKLKTKFERAKKELAKEYAFSNNRIEIGDVITDFSKIICVDSIRFEFGRKDDPIACVYSGVQMTRKLQPMKKGIRRKIWKWHGADIKILKNKGCDCDKL